MRGICCKYLPSQWRIGRRSSLKSFSARARRVSAKAISKPCLRRWKKSRRGEAICDQYCHVERTRQSGSDRNISNYSLGLASLANVERPFDSAQDDKLKEGRHAILSKTRSDSAKASHLVSPQRRGPNVQERGHRLRTRHYDGRIQRSLFHHVSSASAHSCAER